MKAQTCGMKWMVRVAAIFFGMVFMTLALSEAVEAG